MKLANLTAATRYTPQNCAVFFRTRERFGALSNMAAGFPLCVAGLETATSEALYQACRYPHLPGFQRDILNERNPMTAKMKSRTRLQETRADWNDIRVFVMAWVLGTKLTQHEKAFSDVLMSTGTLPIVEKSNKDAFWGAKPQADGTLFGVNILGQLLSDLRDQYRGKTWLPADSNTLAFLNPSKELPT